MLQTGSNLNPLIYIDRLHSLNVIGEVFLYKVEFLYSFKDKISALSRH